MNATESPFKEGEDRCSQHEGGRLSRTLATEEGPGGPSKVQSEGPPATFLARAQQAREV